MMKKFVVVSISTLAIVFLSLDSGAKSKQSEDVLRLPELKLEFNLSKDQVIRGESIPFKLSLTNTGDYQYDIDEIAPSNESVTFIMKGKNNKENVSSFLIPYMKTGGIKKKGTEISRFTINPLQSKVVKGDLLKIFGDIEPGNYRVKARYRSSNGVDIASLEYSVNVNTANPVYANSQWEYDRSAESNFKTVWINKGKRFGLFYMENNPANPEVVELSNKVYEFSGTRDVRISAVNAYMQSFLHLVWTEGQTIMALPIDEGKATGKPIRIPVPFKTASLLDPPFTDDKGNLFLFLKIGNKKGNSSIYFLKVPKDGKKVKREKISDLPGQIKSANMLIDSDSNLTFAASLNKGVAYFVYDLRGERLVVNAKTIDGVLDRVFDVRVAQQFKPEKGSKSTFIYYLTKNKNERSAYTAYLFEIGQKEPKWYPKMNVFYPERLNIIQSVMDSFLRPYYLLMPAGSARVFFQPYFTQDLRQVLPPENRPKDLCTYPKIFLSSSIGDNYGVYVRYIKNRSHFAYKLLEKVKKD